MATTSSAPHPASEVGKSAIPADVWLEIGSEADPLDVLSLSQTCRECHSLFSEKPIWINVLRAYMRRQGAFVNSPSIEDMSVEQLRRAASGPQRWKRLTQLRAVPLVRSPKPGLNGVLLPARLTVIRASQVPRQCPIYYLVPGGRYLITGSVNPHATLRLWDLGSPTEGGATLMTCKDFAHQYVYPDNRPISLSGAVCIVGEAELRVAVTCSHPASPVSSAFVFSVVLGDATQSFRLLGTIRLAAAHVTRRHILGDRVVLILDSKVVLLWHYQEGLASICNRSETAIPGADHDVALTEDYVLYITCGGAFAGVSAWEISRLPKVSHNTTPATAVQLASPPHLQIPALWNGVVQLMCQPMDRAPNTVTFEILRFPGREIKGMCSRYRVKLTPPNYESSSGHGTIEALGATSFPSTGYIPGGGPFSTGLRMLIPDWEAGGKDYRMYTYELGPVYHERSSLRPPALGAALGVGYPIASCAYSGRVIFERDSKKGGKEVFCADYLCERQDSSSIPKSSSTSRIGTRVASAGRLFSKTLGIR